MSKREREGVENESSPPVQIEHPPVQIEHQVHQATHSSDTLSQIGSSSTQVTRPTAIAESEIDDPIFPLFRFQPTDLEALIKVLRPKISDRENCCRLMSFMESDLPAFFAGRRVTKFRNFHDDFWFFLKLGDSKPIIGNMDYSLLHPEPKTMVIRMQEGFIAGRKQILTVKNGKGTSTGWKITEYSKASSDKNRWVLCQLKYDPEMQIVASPAVTHDFENGLLPPGPSHVKNSPFFRFMASDVEAISLVLKPKLDGLLSEKCSLKSYTLPALSSLICGETGLNVPNFIKNEVWFFVSDVEIDQKVRHTEDPEYSHWVCPNYTAIYDEIGNVIGYRRQLKLKNVFGEFTPWRMLEYNRKSEGVQPFILCKLMYYPRQSTVTEENAAEIERRRAERMRAGRERVEAVGRLSET